MKRKIRQVLSLILAGVLFFNMGSTMSFASAAGEVAELEISYTQTERDGNISREIQRDRTWLETIEQGKWNLDSETKGNWLSKYGEDGYVLCGWDGGRDITEYPYYIDSIEYKTEDRSGGYVARNANQAEGNSWWEYGIPTAENPNGTRKIAYRFDDKQQTVCIKANDEDEHILSFYVASENDAGKQQTVKLYKAGTKEQIGEAVTMNKFMEGKYITTRFRGSVDVVFTNDVYKPLNTNALLNGIFFDTHYEGEIPVRKLSITPADGETIRNKGEEVQMTATIYPENATNQTLTWSVLPEGTEVAVVDEHGKLTLNKEGTFIVKAVTNDGKVSDELSMACVEQGNPPEKAEWKHLGDDYVMLQNKDVRVIFELSTGRYNVYEQTSGRPFVLGAYYQVNSDKSTDGYSFAAQEINEQQEGKTLRLTGSKEGKNDILLDISLDDKSGNILLGAGINNTSAEGVKVMQMYPMAAKYQEKGGIFAGPNPEENHAVLTGEGNWIVPKVKQGVNTTSKNNLMISYREEPAKESFLIGQLTTHSFQSTITTKYNPEGALDNNGRKSMDGDIRIYDNTGKLVDAGDSYIGDTALINFTEKNPYDSLENFAVKQADVMDVQLADFDPYIYECLWYVNWFTSGANNADFAVQEVKDLYKKGLANYARPNLRVEPDTYKNPNEQLWWDDAHWKQFGHLTDTYPTMKQWIAAMKEAGGEGGTYMQASYRSDDYCNEFPGHMLYNDANEGPDYTDPDFIKHMSEVYANLKDAGIRSIFYDYAGQYHGKTFGYLLDKKGGFEDKHATAVEAYRNIYALPKEYIGRDVRITENSWEYSGSDVAIGLIDLQRNIHDTNEFSPAIAQASVNQWYRHRTTKLLYPDVKVFENNDLDLRRAQITGTAFLFGKMTLGESVNRMSDDKIKDVGKSVPFPIDGVSARPVGLFEDEYVQKGLTNPEVMDYKFKSSYDDHILLFWNETKAGKNISADLGKDTAFGGVGLDPEKEYDIWDFWDWNYLGRVKGSEVLTLPVRKNEMKTMAVREVRSTPYLLSTNRHLLQGTQEIEAKNITWNDQNSSLTGTFEVVANDTFKAIIPVPEGLKLRTFTIENPNVEDSVNFNTAGRYVEVTLDAKANQSVPFVMEFEEGSIPKDTASPSAITNLRASADDFGIVSLTWDPSTDDSGAVYYEVHGSDTAGFTPNADTRLAITTNTGYTAGDPPAGDYYYMVLAKDAAGNAGISATVKTNAKAMAIPLDRLTATSGDNQSGQEAAKVLDNNPTTLWHTKWNETVPRDKMWIDLGIKNGPAAINSLQYLPRSDKSQTTGLTKNGIFVKYRVDISKDNGQTYQTLIQEGTFPGIEGWQTITFDEPEEVTNVRLYCLESADTGNQWASAAEMRLYTAAEFEGISMREEKVSLSVGDQKTLLVDFFPTNYQKPLTFKSDNPEVAAIDANGVVTGVSKGITKITAEAEGKTAECIVEVKEKDVTVQQAEAAAKAAKEAAEAAKKAAANAADAQSVAEKAAEAAKAAKENASMAAQTAGENSAAAVQAKNAALEAQKKAETAGKLAVDAQTAAEKSAQAAADAQTAAEEALNGAVGALKKAETARDAALQAQQSAEQSKDAAEKSAESAEEYANLAIAAKDVAVAAKEEALKAQEAAERAQRIAEEKAAEAERAIQEAQKLKKEMEDVLARVRFENTRVTVKTAKSSKKGQVKIGWKKVEGAEGYVIQYATKTSFKGKKTVTVKSGKATGTTIRKLKRGKKYYFRIRAYRMADGEKIYTSFSAKKVVKKVK